MRRILAFTLFIIVLSILVSGCLNNKHADNMNNSYEKTDYKSKFITESYDSEGRVIVNFGSPNMDGKRDDIWNYVPTIIPEIIVGSRVKTTAQIKLLWDDNALYVYFEVKDNDLNKDNIDTYQQDSVEIYLDEYNNKASSYEQGELHYRVNYDNNRSADNGEIHRFYTVTRKTNTGYIVETRISWEVKPENGRIMGFDVQINDSNFSGMRLGTINLFDSSGTAYINPSKMGELILKGKSEDSTSGPNPYDLKAYLAYLNNLDMNVYINRDVMNEPINHAKAVLTNKNSNQSDFDQALNNLKETTVKLDRGKGFVEPIYLESMKELPDPFTFLDGSMVKTIDDWFQRAVEIKRMYEFYAYGALPDTSDEIVSYSKNEFGMDIIITSNNKTVSFPVYISIPKNNKIQGPYPVIIALWGLEPSLLRLANQRGYAVISMPTDPVATDNLLRQGAFYELYPYNRAENDVGVLMAWTWGISRIIDVLEQDAYEDLNAEQVIVTGMSRFGKAALVAGAFEERILVTNPVSSGLGGAASFRYSFEGKQYEWGIAAASQNLNRLQSASERQRFTSIFTSFKSFDQIPFDQHQLASLVAPRYLLISGGYQDYWSNPEGTYVTYLGASKVYEFLGVNNLGIAYRIGGHGMYSEDMDNLLDFCDYHLRGLDKQKDFKSTEFITDPSYDTIITPK